jgi:biopolymer transport protein ExbD
MTISAGGRNKAEINMTPLIDVLLVLIIIFMVITPLTPRGLPTLVAQPPSGEPHDENRYPEIVVTVRSDRTLLLNSEPLNLTSLRARLEHFYKNGATRVIFVRGEKAIEFGRVAEVIDMARGAGFYHIALMTDWVTSPGQARAANAIIKE